jgi:hypothetical protein
MFAVVSPYVEGTVHKGNSNAINNACTFDVETALVVHAAWTFVHELSTCLPHELCVLESLNSTFRVWIAGGRASSGTGAMGKKGSQDSSTCDINTKRRVLQPDFIVTYSVVDSCPQKLSTENTTT